MIDSEKSQIAGPVKTTDEARRFLEAEQKTRVEECSRRIQAALAECACRLEPKITIVGAQVSAEILVLPTH